MAYGLASKRRLVARIRRIAGQIASLERALEDEAGCDVVLHQLAGARGALDGLMEEVLADFVREHVAAPKLAQDARSQAAEELVAIIRRYAR